MIFLRHHFAGLRVFSGAGNGEFSFALQQLQGITGLLRTRFLDHREDFIFQILFAQIIE